MRWNRRPRLPDEARDSLGLERGEQLLAAAQRPDGGWVVATDRALLEGGHRLDWTHAAHAEWDSEASMLTVTAVGDEAGGPEQTHAYALTEPGFLPETVHERVMASIVAIRRVRVRGHRGVRVVARRGAGSHEISWQVVIDAGVDPDDPLVQAAAEDLMAEMRAELGG